MSPDAASPSSIHSFRGNRQAEKVLAGFPNTPFWSAIPLGGGAINATYRLTTKDDGQWFCKINDSTSFPDFFREEQHPFLDFFREE